MNGTRKFGRLVAAIAAVTLIATACGDDDTGGDTATTDGTTTDGDDTGGGDTGDDGQAAACDSPGVSEDEIRVGLINTTSGQPAVAAFYQSFGQGSEARFAYENETNGGVGDRELTIEKRDDAGDPDQNRSAAQELVESVGVFGLIEFPSSGRGSKDYLNEQGVPVTGWITHSGFGEYENFFGYAGSTSPDPEGTPTTTASSFIREQMGGTNVAIFGGGNPASVAAANNAAEGAAAVDLEVGYKQVDIQRGQTDFSADIERMEQAGVDSMISMLDTQTSLSLLAAVRQAQLPVQHVYFVTGYDQRLLESEAAPLLEGVVFSVEFAPFELERPGHQTYLDALEEHAPGTDVGQGSMIGWLSADLFIRGLHEAGEDCPTREAFIENLRAVDDYDGMGLLPPKDQSELLGIPVLCFYHVQVEEGAFVPMSDEPWCGEVVES